MSKGAAVLMGLQGFSVLLSYFGKLTRGAYKKLALQYHPDPRPGSKAV